MFSQVIIGCSRGGDEFEMEGGLWRFDRVPEALFGPV